MIRAEFPYATGGGRAFALRCHVISSVGERELFRSLLIDCTVAHLVLQNYVADYINIPCFGTSVKWTCSEPVRSTNGLHDQKSLHETCLSGLEEREGAFIEADRELTVCSSHFAMVTHPWGYDIVSCQN